MLHTDVHKIVYSYWDTYHKELAVNYTVPEPKYKEIYYVPYSLTCNKYRYPSWFWLEDERQIMNSDQEFVKTNNMIKRDLD